MWLAKDIRRIFVEKTIEIFLEKAVGGALVLAAGILELLLLQTWLAPVLNPPPPVRPIPIPVDITPHLAPPTVPVVSAPGPEVNGGEVIEIPILSGGRPVAQGILGTCGDIGKFRSIVFSDVFSWAFQEKVHVELNGREIDLRQFLRGEGPQKIMASAEEIVAVGTASCEGFSLPFRRDVREEERAQARASQLSAWIQEVLPPGPPSAPVQRVHTLNLGRYQRDEPCNPKNHPETRNQRKVILVAVLQRDPALGLAECLKTIFGQHDSLEPLVSRYSRFGLDEDWTLLQGSSPR